MTILTLDKPETKTLLDEDVFRLFFKPGEIVEIRCFEGKIVSSGYFDDHGAFCQCVRELEKKQHTGMYFTPQVIDPRLIARSYNRIKQREPTTSDKDVLFYRWFPVDLDPVRPSGISSSDSELRAALELREPVKDWIMREYGFSHPIEAMSGNGGHLLFMLPDWPVNDQNKNIFKLMLEEVSKTFSTERVKIDTSVFNPSRIWKLYGTTARKGDEIPANQFRGARPHRRAYIDNMGGQHA